MKEIMEIIFDIIYLITVITLGIIMICKSKTNKQYRLFGIMAVVLGFGDSFHLIPRIIALATTGLESYTYVLGIGKLITSITMTFFYVILYYVWKIRYQDKNTLKYEIILYSMTALRIILCLLPQNEWTSIDAPLSYSIYRNIPFAIIGILVIILFYKSAKQNNDKNFKFMYLTIVLSFAFYIPVVLFADKYPLIGLLMIPKTCAYVWTVVIGFIDMKKELKQNEKIS